MQFLVVQVGEPYLKFYLLLTRPPIIIVDAEGESVLILK